MSRKTVFFLFKLVFGLGLMLYLLLYIARPREIIAVFHHVSWPMVLLAFCLHTFGFLISAKRWKLILDEKGADLSIPQLLRSLLVGSFFNLFLPTRFGGDVVRVSDTRHIDQGVTASLAVIVYERMSGIVALLLLAMLSSLLKLSVVKEMPFLYVSLPVSLLGIVPAGAGLEKTPARIFGKVQMPPPLAAKDPGQTGQVPRHHP